VTGLTTFQGVRGPSYMRRISTRRIRVANPAVTRWHGAGERPGLRGVKRGSSVEIPLGLSKAPKGLKYACSAFPLNPTPLP